MDAVVYKQERKNAFSAFLGNQNLNQLLVNLNCLCFSNTTGNFKDIKSENILLMINRISLPF